MSHQRILLQTLILWIFTPSLFLMGQIKTSTNVLKIEPFSTIPAEINGGGCYFSNDSIEFKKGNYIYVNDFAEKSYLKINGVMIEFTQTEHTENNGKVIAKAKSELYNLKVIINKTIKTEYETSYLIGVIQVTDKKGNKVTNFFYGLCGY